MKPKQEKPSPADDLDVEVINLERIPVENIAQVTETLDRVRISAQKLTYKLADATEMFARGEINEIQLRIITEPIGETLNLLNRGMKIVLSAAQAKQKLNSGK